MITTITEQLICPTCGNENVTKDMLELNNNMCNKCYNKHLFHIANNMDNEDYNIN